jgi:YtkA-like protein
MIAQRNRVVSRVMAVVLLSAACGRSNGASTLTELHRVRSGSLDVVLLSRTGALHHGRDALAVEFRSASSGTLVDVGSVKASAVMPMGGTPMLGRVELTKTEVPGRYAATSDFSMAGTWRTTFEWNGPSGQGSVTLSTTVQ